MSSAAFLLLIYWTLLGFLASLAAMKSFLFLLTAVAAHAQLVDVPELGLRVQRGFRASVFSDEKLANDIWSMTLSPRGEVVVSGAGYIATLLDEDGDGKAERAVEFAKVKGAMGLCFGEDGRQLLVMNDGWLWEYRDENLDRIADSAPRKILPFASGEHGGHAIRKGPDGWWWIIGGNDAGIDHRHDPKKKAMAGAILRLSPDMKTSEVVADGFRNPYDFDFNESGDFFTYDSDCERDYFLPWYSGTRVYHVGLGRSHGWRLPGYQRSFRIPDYMPATVPALADLGRGSPTGVLVAKAPGFPAKYRGGLFVCDWTFGKVHFLPLVQRDAADASLAEAQLRSDLSSVLGESAYTGEFVSALRRAHYVTEPEVFIEPMGSHGFAPTDIEQAKDGSLFVSIGGRRTRGAVYRFIATPQDDIEPFVFAEPRIAKPTLAVLEVVQEKLGGWRISGASAEAFVPYEAMNPKGLSDEQKTLALSYAQNALLSLDEPTQMEAARVLAMLEDNSEISAKRILDAVSQTSSATSDFHFLASYARLKAASGTVDELAAAILRFDSKLAGGDQRPKQNWAIRLNEVIAKLFVKHPGLPAALLKSPGFATSARVPMVDVFPHLLREQVAERFLDAAKHDPNWPWNAEFVQLIAPLPAAREPLFAQWKNSSLRKILRPILEQGATGAELEILNAKEPEVVVAELSPFIESLKAIYWANGDAVNGAKVFAARACATCHSGTSPIGPELAGPVARLSAVDLMTEIQFPSRNIAEAFRAINYTMKDGSIVSGFTAFLSADGVLVQTVSGTQRIAEADIVRREESRVSLMPAGLLSGLSGRELADLLAYLKSTGK
jgi:putative heme-binding domain-containing protein